MWVRGVTGRGPSLGIKEGLVIDLGLNLLDFQKSLKYEKGKEGGGAGGVEARVGEEGRGGGVWLEGRAGDGLHAGEAHEQSGRCTRKTFINKYVLFI